MKIWLNLDKTWQKQSAIFEFSITNKGKSEIAWRIVLDDLNKQRVYPECKYFLISTTTT